ncbi:MAG: hypothetical protein ABL955_11450 [Elusimicrobiota bacterium]
MKLAIPNFERPSQLTLVLLLYSWIAGYLLGRPLSLLFLLPLGLISSIVPAQILGVIAFPILFSGRFFVVAFFFTWLTEGPWIQRAFVAWITTIVAAWLEIGTAGSVPEFAAFMLFTLLLPGTVHLGMALFGSWVANKYLWHPNMQRARDLIFRIVILPLPG